jgi:hypothetical protein
MEALIEIEHCMVESGAFCPFCDAFTPFDGKRIFPGCDHALYVMPYLPRSVGVLFYENSCTNHNSCDNQHKEIQS